MSLSTSFEGDPESCWRTAERLAGLARALEDARGFVAAQATSSPDDFDGWSADAFRLSAGRLHGQTQRCETACHELAVALTAFGTSLDTVRLALRRTRELARQHLVVEGEEILRPGPYADDGQRRTYELVEQTLDQARRFEHQAHRDWQAALAEHAGTAAVPAAELPGSAVPTEPTEPAGSAGPVRPHVPAADAPVRPPVPPAGPVFPAGPAVDVPVGAPVGAAGAAGAAAAGVLTRQPRPPHDLDLALDLALEAPGEDDWAPATPTPHALPVPVPWEVPDGPR
ncbi:hypothetical protein NPS01_33770 [Nocardioides psychrotolerans]|uniref:Uncharacterized protein n=1 Tax=Nocardioides psychrotolerans TaxID=1005945 RepID=A0A1I3PMM4_9ACTN|nr:hypothetical protein [Nocardioides psychrotolerans]GEP39714.1 hypothetical protein NPS01_33770 [Nocardioides psychrotolerans]SFJ22808.1 hypothetical protein SAMN05216561_12141 [Nocardioides psychrotolerans]